MSELNVEIETEIYKKVEKLNLETFVLVCKLDRYKDKMTEQLYKYMTEQLGELYKNEYMSMTGEYLIDRATEIYENEIREAVYVPHKSKFFRRRNKAAKLIEEKVNQEAEKYFAKCGELLSELDEAAEAPPADAAELAPPNPQKSRKRGLRNVDHDSDRNDKAPKTGKTRKKEETECKK